MKCGGLRVKYVCNVVSFQKMELILLYRMILNSLKDVIPEPRQQVLLLSVCAVLAEF